jgi:hypothetical protein
MRTLVADEVKSMEQLIKTLGLKGAAIHRPANQTLHVTLNSDVKVTLPSPGIAVNLNNFGSVNSPVLLSANGAKPDIRRSHQYAVKF